MSNRYFYGFDAGEAENRLRKIVRNPEPGAPAVHELKDAVAVPVVHGLYDTDGRRINVAAVRTLSADAPPLRHEKLHKGAAERITLPDQLKVVDESVLFGGYLMKHYGHFVIESMSRLWARDRFADLPIVFTSPHKFSRKPPAFATDIFEGLGIQRRILLVDEPTLFRQVVCPGTAFEYRWKAFSVADEPHTAAAKALAANSQRRWRRPVYLTRSGLSEDLRKSDSEPELEAELSARGFDIVRPEELALVDQIAIFEQSPLVAGTVGSALHTALFSRSTGTLVTLNWGRGFEHYLLVDGVKRHQSYYLKSMKRYDGLGDYSIDVGLTLRLLEEAGLIENRARVVVR